MTVHRCTVRSPLIGYLVTSRPREEFSRYSKWLDNFRTALVRRPAYPTALWPSYVRNCCGFFRTWSLFPDRRYSIPDEIWEYLRIYLWRSPVKWIAAREGGWGERGWLVISTTVVNFHLHPFLYPGAAAPMGQGFLIVEGFTIALWHTALGRTPLDEWSAWRRDLYLITHNTHNRQTSFSPRGLESTIPPSERPQIHGLDRAVTVTGFSYTMEVK